MIVKAFCARSFTYSVRKAAGVVPVVSPPTTVETFDPAALSNCDLLYLKLHGLAQQAYWYGDNWLTAASKEQIETCDLEGPTARADRGSHPKPTRGSRLDPGTGTIVFAANCFLPESPMLDALFAAGARCVVAGHGPNLGGRTKLLSSDLLGRYFRRGLQIGLSPKHALRLAKARLILSRRSAGKKDALAFKLFWPPQSNVGARFPRPRS